MECETHQVCAVAKPLVDRADCHYLQHSPSIRPSILVSGDGDIECSSPEGILESRHDVENGSHSRSRRRMWPSDLC